MNEQAPSTHLEILAQTLINLFLVSDNFSTTREQYKATVAAVIYQAKKEAVQEIEQRLGCDIQTAADRLEDFDWSAQDAMQAEEEPAYSQLETIWQKEEYTLMSSWNGEAIHIARQP